jgi:hypothetical protein
LSPPQKAADWDFEINLVFWFFADQELEFSVRAEWVVRPEYLLSVAAEQDF